jgi:hypothetical protein
MYIGRASRECEITTLNLSIILAFFIEVMFKNLFLPHIEHTGSQHESFVQNMINKLCRRTVAFESHIRWN